MRAAALAARRAAKEAEVRKTDNLKGIEIKSSIAVVTTREIDIESDMFFSGASLSNMLTVIHMFYSSI